MRASVGFVRCGRRCRKSLYGVGDRAVLRTLISASEQPRRVEYSLADGTAYVREPPSPGVPHQFAVSELLHQIANALEDIHWRVFVAPLDIRLPKSTELDDLVDTVVQPDIFITGDPSKLDKRGMRGAPDWLGEVVSPSTARYDRCVKIPIYERAGVREVWLVVPPSLQVAIYRLEDGHYPRPATVEMKGQTELTAVPGVVINWNRLVARCP